jgi:hypothetical protein
MTMTWSLMGLKARLAFLFMPVSKQSTIPFPAGPPTRQPRWGGMEEVLATAQTE